MDQKVNQRGGRRPNAGRPKGSGRYGENTKPMRVPVRLEDRIVRFLTRNEYEMPFYESKSPTDGYNEVTFDLMDSLLPTPSSNTDAPQTFFLRVAGDSMTDAGIFQNDILVVNKAADYENGSIVVAIVAGEFNVKRYKKYGDKAELVPENPKYPTIDVTNSDDIEIWGVVEHVIRSV